MALLFADNFSHYGTPARMLEGAYAEADGSLVVDPDGVSTGRVFFTGTGSARKVLPSTNETTGVAIRLWMPQLPVAASTFFPGIAFRNLADRNIVSVCPTTTGALQINNYSNDALNIWTSVAAVTTGPVITASGWYHLEVTYNSTTKECKVYVEGREVLSATSTTTTTGTVAQVTFGGIRGGGGSATATGNFKDFVAWNGAGVLNTSQIGTVQVISLDVNSDVAQPWAATPPGTPGYDILSNNPPDNAQYLTAAFPVPDPYIGTLSDLPPDVSSVKGIVTFARFTKTDGGDAELTVSLLSDGETAAGAVHTGSVAQTYWLDVFETDPATGMPWTPVAVDDLEIKLDRLS